MRGSSCVLISAATISGTVAERAYQIAPPTRNAPAVMRSAFALHAAIALPAAARGRASADMGPTSTVAVGVLLKPAWGSPIRGDPRSPVALVRCLCLRDRR